MNEGYNEYCSLIPPMEFEDCENDYNEYEDYMSDKADEAYEESLFEENN